MHIAGRMESLDRFQAREVVIRKLHAMLLVAMFIYLRQLGGTHYKCAMEIGAQLQCRYVILKTKMLWAQFQCPAEVGIQLFVVRCRGR